MEVNIFSDIINPIIDLANTSIQNSRHLSMEILQVTKPPTGPYAVFHHISHLIERTSDVKHILRRMVENKAKLVVLAEKESKVRLTVTIKPGKPVPIRLNKIMNQNHDLTESMKLDMESLYIFGNLVLDQWSLVTAYISGMPDPEKVNFRFLVEQLQSKKYKGILSKFWETHKRDLVWLYYQLRFYRNTFVEHVDRPWQRGNTGSVYGHDFNLFIPSPPGWHSDEKIKKDLEGILHLSPDWIKNASDDYWEKKNLKRTLEIIFNQIDNIEEFTDREMVWNVWRKVGGSTPSYEVIGRRLLSFLSNSIPTIENTIFAL